MLLAMLSDTALQATSLSANQFYTFQFDTYPVSDDG